MRSAQLIEAESLRLTGAGREEASETTFGSVAVLVSSTTPCNEVLERAQSVLRVVNQHALGEWPVLETWKTVLPAWFVARCAPERTPEQLEARKRRLATLSIEEKRRESHEEQWPLSNWLFWFKPENRQWYWWDTRLLAENRAIVTVEVEAWPFAWQSLSWLLRASGAMSIDLMTPDQSSSLILPNMDINRLFEMRIRVRPGPGCPMPPHLIGADVYCFVAAPHHLTALEQAVERLRSRHFVFEDLVNSVVKERDPQQWDIYVERVWSDLRDHFPRQEDIQRLMERGGVLFGPFLSWEKET
jgi:hypothetical protein